MFYHRSPCHNIRIYRLRNKVLECFTTDHRVIISPEKEYLSRAMGIELHVDIDYRTVSVEADDYFIFSTDGVHEYIKSKDIVKI